jgi:hypothetical protein
MTTGMPLLEPAAAAAKSMLKSSVADVVMPSLPSQLDDIRIPK